MYEQCGFFPAGSTRAERHRCSTIYSGFQERRNRVGSTIKTLESAQMREKEKIVATRPLTMEL